MRELVVVERLGGEERGDAPPPLEHEPAPAEQAQLDPVGGDARRRGLTVDAILLDPNGRPGVSRRGDEDLRPLEAAHGEPVGPTW